MNKNEKTGSFQFRQKFTTIKSSKRCIKNVLKEKRGRRL